jgi:cupin 2 domain-containing protein
MHGPKNLFHDIPSSLPAELIETLAESDAVRIERIISRAHTSPPDAWYDQDTHEFVVLLQGRARLQFADSDTLVSLNPGDYLSIPAHQQHRVDWTDPEHDTVWLTVHYK